MSILALDRAKEHLRLSKTATHENTDVQMKLEAAEAIILGYLARPSDAAWTATMAAWDEDTVPKEVEAAILLQLGELYRYRGDEEASEIPDREHGYLSPVITAVLHRLKDPALA